MRCKEMPFRGKTSLSGAKKLHTMSMVVQLLLFFKQKICQNKENVVSLQSVFYKRINKQVKHQIMSEIESKVKAIIVDKLGVDEAEVKAEASFTNDLGADSLDTVELIMEFEKEFGISIPDDKAETIQTVGDAVKYIEENAK